MKALCIVGGFVLAVLLLVAWLRSLALKDFLNWEDDE